jgi:hypothetical protein
MATPDVKDIVQRLEKVEKQNRRHKFLSVFVIFLFLVLMVSPQLFAISVPGLDSVWNAINDIKDLIDFEVDFKSRKFVAQEHFDDGTPRTELNKYALAYYDYSGTERTFLRFHEDNIGINTKYITPCRALHVAAENTMVQLRLQRTINAPGIVDMGTANDNLYFYPGGYDKKNGNVIIDTTGKVGIGVTSPQYQLHVKGSVRALKVDTGDIVFQKHGRKLWRMFEDEKGLYLENIKTKKVYSFVLKEVNL